MQLQFKVGVYLLNSLMILFPVLLYKSDASILVYLTRKMCSSGLLASIALFHFFFSLSV